MTAAAGDPPLVIKGWSVYAHPQFLDTFESLVAQVERLRVKDPKGYTAKNSTKRLAAIVTLAFEIIPQDPARPEYRQGAALGDEYKHWFRAKFFQQTIPTVFSLSPTKPNHHLRLGQRRKHETRV